MNSPEYIAHGTGSPESAKSIREEGFRFEEGRETVSSDFFLALDWAEGKPDTLAGTRNTNGTSENEPGSIVVMKVPEGYKVDYGTETGIEVDDENKTITGHVGKYSGGRMQLGIYRKELADMGVNAEELKDEENPLAKASELMRQDTDLEKKVGALKKLELILGVDKVVAEIKATPEIVSLSNKLKNEIFSFQTRVPEAVKALASEIEKENREKGVHQYKDRAELETILNQMLEGSLVNYVQIRIRRLGLQIKMLGGYQVEDRDKIPGAEFQTPDKEKIGEELERITSIASKEDFTTGLPKLDRYISINLGNLQREFSSLE